LGEVGPEYEKYGATTTTKVHTAGVIMINQNQGSRRSSNLCHPDKDFFSSMTGHASSPVMIGIPGLQNNKFIGWGRGAVTRL
jgi:hypothetical protein